MNILLIFPAYSRNRNGMFFPLGLASISACLKAAGHQVTGINFNNYDEALRLPHLEQLLRENTFHLVGTGGLSVTMDGVADIVGHVRRLSPASLVVLGGGLITADPLVQFLHLRPDIAVRGEGEETMVELASLLEQGSRDFSQISGIVYWSNGEPRFTPERPAIANLDQLPMEDLATFGMGEYIAMQKGLVTTNYHRTERNLGPRAIIATSRSCPYRCTFCFHPASQTYRRYSLQRSMETILSIRDTYDVHTFGIVDELFDYGPHRIKEFCQALADHDIKINWVCQLRVNKVSRELLATLKKAGCYLINYGFESGSDTILDSMRKRIKARDVEKAFHLTREAGIAIQANFLFGDPAESRQTVQESMDFQQRNKMFFIDWSAVIPYPGTPLYHRNMEKGLISDPIAFTRQIADDSTYLWNYAQP
ncbi:MAG: radical SAM protein, partial [Magnetococcales bacterium]|nr:radical SAM protein [Magnetococcales bacterium]